MTSRLAPDIDANLVVGTLYQGSKPHLGDSLKRHVDVVALTALEYQPSWQFYKRGGLVVIKAPMDDNGVYMSQKERSAAIRAAHKVRKHLDMGRIVLSTCYAGMNRSGLVSALALMLPSSAPSPTPGSLNANQAVAIVREARGPKALSSKVFLDFINMFESMRSSKISRI